MCICCILRLYKSYRRLYIYIYIYIYSFCIMPTWAHLSSASLPLPSSLSLSPLRAHSPSLFSHHLTIHWRH